MNKKIFGLFLVVAALLSAASFQSCKDNDSDLYNEVLIKDTQHYNELKNRIDAIENSLGNVDCEALKSDVDALKAEVAALKAKLDEFPVDKLNDVVARIEALEAQNTEILAAVEALQFNYEELLARVEALEDSLCREDCAALKAELEALKAKVAAANLDRVNELLNRVNTLEQQMKLKGVTVQSVYTPAFGSFNSAVGLNSNILLGYSGKITTGDPNFGNTGLPGGDVFTKNLGTIYLTVDPLNVSAANYNVALLSSTGTSAGITMTPLKVAEKDIILGYTRANNYLYETTAELTNTAKVQHVTLNTQGYKDALKDIINYKDGINFSNIASLIYNTVHTDLRANAVEVSYVGESVISKYEISAAVVKPLGITTVEALGSINGNAVASKVSSVANKVVGKVQSVLADRFDDKLISFEVEKITLIPAGSQIKVVIPKNTIEIQLNASVTGGGGGNVSGTGKNDKDIEFYIPASDFAGMFDGAQNQINEMIDMVNNYISKINNAWTTITTGSGSALIDKAVEVIVNKTLSVAERASHLANPTLFVVDGGKLKRLSTIAAAPTVLENATVELIPSSNSLELVVPFYKKYLKATGATIIAENGDDINGDTFDGTVLRAKMTVPAGPTAITYEVADYYGTIKQITCYVQK